MGERREKRTRWRGRKGGKENEGSGSELEGT